jgi:anthranilate phosphoribosyltransferase
MHGTEGEVYANPLRCPQLMLIDAAGTRAVLERGEENTDVILPQVKDPHSTAQWIEQCLAGHVPVPHSIKLQMACCLLATGEVETVEAGMQRVERAF